MEIHDEEIYDYEIGEEKKEKIEKDHYFEKEMKEIVDYFEIVVLVFLILKKDDHVVMIIFFHILHNNQN